MDRLNQLEHEIRRHLAMARITTGTIRADHLTAARLLTEIYDMLKKEKSP